MPNIVTKIESRDIEHKLTAEDKAALADKMARQVHLIGDYELRKKAEADHYNGKIKEANTRLKELADQESTGYERRVVSVQIDFNYTDGQVYVYRTDTWELIEVRLMTEAERQRSLFDDTQEGWPEPHKMTSSGPYPYPHVLGWGRSPGNYPVRRYGVRATRGEPVHMVEVCEFCGRVGAVTKMGKTGPEFPEGWGYHPQVEPICLVCSKCLAKDLSKEPGPGAHADPGRPMRLEAAVENGIAELDNPVISAETIPLMNEYVRRIVPDATDEEVYKAWGKTLTQATPADVIDFPKEPSPEPQAGQDAA